MKYMLLIYSTEAGKASATPLDMKNMLAAYMAYSDALKKAGAFVVGDELAPSSTASTVRMAAGKTKVLDGPYADAKEQLGGYYIIDVADLDAATKWAARCPGASHGIVEVRPLVVHG